MVTSANSTDGGGLEGGGEDDVDVSAAAAPAKPYKVDHVRLAAMYQKISEDPRLLTPAAGRATCCIFRVPESLVEINGKSHKPQIVSIGPHHSGDPQLQMIQEHKWRYLGALLARLQNQQVLLEDLMAAVAPLVPIARECYSEIIPLDTDDFIEMMVLDGCFMIELFRKTKQLVAFESHDPLVTMAWIFPFFYRDFIRLENQIPYFVLERLYEVTTVPGVESQHTLAEIALEFFNDAMQRSDEDIANYRDISGNHLLDLVRESYMPRGMLLEVDEPRGEVTHVIQSVSMLRRAGIRLSHAKHDSSFLVVKFTADGVIEMPTIVMDEFMSLFLHNCVAYEQCHRSSSKYITTYAALLYFLVNTYKDVDYLCDRKIIENSLGTNKEVAKFIHNLGKDVVFDIGRCYLVRFFNDVQQYYFYSWHVQWEGVKYTYFGTPWSFISSSAAFILLLLAVAQTYFTIYSAYN